MPLLKTSLFTSILLVMSDVVKEKYCISKGGDVRLRVGRRVSDSAGVEDLGGTGDERQRWRRAWQSCCNFGAALFGA